MLYWGLEIITNIIIINAYTELQYILKNNDMHNVITTNPIDLHKDTNTYWTKWINNYSLSL